MSHFDLSRFKPIPDLLSTIFSSVRIFLTIWQYFFCSLIASRRINFFIGGKKPDATDFHFVYSEWAFLNTLTLPREGGGERHSTVSHRFFPFFPSYVPVTSNLQYVDRSEG